MPLRNICAAANPNKVCASLMRHVGMSLFAVNVCRKFASEAAFSWHLGYAIARRGNFGFVCCDIDIHYDLGSMVRTAPIPAKPEVELTVVPCSVTICRERLRMEGQSINAGGAARPMRFEPGASSRSAPFVTRPPTTRDGAPMRVR
jgi:hypothetical protein